MAMVIPLYDIIMYIVYYYRGLSKNNNNNKCFI